MVLTLFALGCQGGDDDVVAVQAALGGVSTANVQLQVSKNACATNVAQDYFKVTNATTAPLKLSQISIKYWINDTSVPAIVPAVWYGGCVTSAKGTCLHTVTGVSASAVRFAPACGPDASHRANWEITISTTDPSPIAAGQIWSNIQSAATLSNWAPFTPGSGTWYSGCGTGQPFASDAHFAVYVDGDLVTGGQPPSCRAPVLPDAGATGG